MNIKKLLGNPKFNVQYILITTLLLSYILGLHNYVPSRTLAIFRNIFVIVGLLIVSALYIHKKEYIIPILIVISIYVSFPQNNRSEGFDGHCNWASILLPEEDAKTVPYKSKRYVPPMPKTQIYRYDKKVKDDKINIS